MKKDVNLILGHIWCSVATLTTSSSTRGLATLLAVVLFVLYLIEAFANRKDLRQ